MDGALTQPTTPTPAAAATNASEKLDRRILAIGGVVVLGAIMAMLDITVINVALDQLIIEFDTTLDTMQWVATGYTLALATVIPLSGWAADRFGTKRVYLTAVSLFMTGSALAGTAWSAESLILFRVLQGLGGGMLLPLSMTILTKAAGPAADRPDDGRARHSDGARPDPRPRPRRLARRRRVVALDLLPERPGRRPDADPRRARPPRGRAAADGEARRARPAPALAGPGRADLRPRPGALARGLRTPRRCTCPRAPARSW